MKGTNCCVPGCSNRGNGHRWPTERAVKEVVCCHSSGRRFQPTAEWETTTSQSCVQGPLQAWRLQTSQFLRYVSEQNVFVFFFLLVTAEWGHWARQETNFNIACKFGCQRWSSLGCQNVTAVKTHVPHPPPLASTSYEIIRRLEHQHRQLINSWINVHFVHLFILSFLLLLKQTLGMWGKWLF